MTDASTEQLLIEALKEQSSELKGLRSDLSAMGKKMASVETMTMEISRTRHQLRDELHGLLSKMERRIGDVESRRLPTIEQELAERRGAFKVLTWVASGGGLLGMIGGLVALLQQIPGPW